MYKILLSVIGLMAFSAFSSTAQVTLARLTCEHQVDPQAVNDLHPRFGWELQSAKRNVSQKAYEVIVWEGKKPIWKTGRVESDQSQYIAYGGPALSSGKAYQWQVRVWDQDGTVSAWSLPAVFRLGLLDSNDWKASWIESARPEDGDYRGAHYFRRAFRTAKTVRSAWLYITAHGMYEAQLNGKRVGDAYLSPGWTSYNKRLPYQVYDVKDQLQKGDNALGVVVGNGWYRGFLAWGDNKDIYGKQLGVLCQLSITYTDGTTEQVASDGQWLSSDGAIRFCEIYHGETVDARKEKTGWSSPLYDAAGWVPVKAVSHSLSNLVAAENEPIRKHETFRPVKIFTTPKGEQVIDFGQNLVGWVKIKASGNNGDSIMIRHAEVLDKFGNFYTENLRAARATATYILKGGGEEAFEGHFSFYGFRYIQLVHYPGTLKPEQVEAVALYSDMPLSGTFTSSHPLLNQLQHNIQWGQRGNFLDVPTDCPQRDERLGWTGDAQAFSRTAAFNFDVRNFFSKWLKDVAADQLPNGSVPFVIPNVLGEGAAGSTGWADAATIIPWNMYLAYGDPKILSQQYASMKAWVGYMEHNSKEDLWNTGFHFGDWLFYRPFDDNDGRSAVTDKYLIAQCFYAHSTQILINTARVLGKQEDQRYYEHLLERIKNAFAREYITPNGRLVSGTQTAYVLALNFDMLPESLRAQAADRLVENIKSYGNHLSTGFLGTPYLCHVLTRFGKDDMAYQLMLQESYPSWLYPVKMGATTIWERWNGIRTDSSFEPASMNSFNHYAYGAIGDWMYRSVAGLDTDGEGPGYKRIRIQPHIGKGLDHAAASLHTPYGLAESKWSGQNGRLTLDVTIPPNTTATVFLPAVDADKVKEGESLLKEVPGLKVVGTFGGFVQVVVGSGAYHFSINE